MVVSLVAAGTGKAPLAGSRGGKAQKFGKRSGSGLMQGRTYGHFDGLQIQTSGLAAALEDHAQQLIYFARYLLTDRLRRFFSWADGELASVGRIWQI